MREGKCSRCTYLLLPLTILCGSIGFLQLYDLSWSQGVLSKPGMNSSANALTRACLLTCTDVCVWVQSR